MASAAGSIITTVSFALLAALIVRFITGRFLHRYDPTLEDEYKKKLEVDGETYELSIFDTAGQVGIFFLFYFPA